MLDLPGTEGKGETTAGDAGEEGETTPGTAKEGRSLMAPGSLWSPWNRRWS
jgi:hypothetical protein